MNTVPSLGISRLLYFTILMNLLASHHGIYLPLCADTCNLRQAEHLNMRRGTKGQIRTYFNHPKSLRRSRYGKDEATMSRKRFSCSLRIHLHVTLVSAPRVCKTGQDPSMGFFKSFQSPSLLDFSFSVLQT